MKKIIYLSGALLLCLGILLQGCRISISLTGATISPELKTFSVEYFPNRAPTVLPTLSQDFTDALIDRCKTQTPLRYTNEIGDVSFEGEITDFKIQPVAITSDESAAMNRLTISVRVKYTNSVEPEWNFESSFSHYEDYSSSMNPTDAQDELTPDIIEQLTEDIFNKAFVNW